jgi:hypothetical protein
LPALGALNDVGVGPMCPTFDEEVAHAHKAEVVVTVKGHEHGVKSITPDAGLGR